MFWHLDYIDENKAGGWMYDRDNKNLDLEILAMCGEHIVGKAIANEQRPDVGAAGHPKADCGFSLRFNEPVDLEKVVLLCMNCSKGHNLVVYSPNKHEIGTVRTSYQSFAGQGGSSKSAKKLDKIGLPPLKGLSVLDIGCNEGFFCQHAYLSGASRVLGIDQSELFIENAKARIPREVLQEGRTLEFRCASWWDLPDEKFDLILFLSAIHYEPEQKKLLDKLVTHLKPNGGLVLECGVIKGPGKRWSNIQRSIDVRRFPTQDYLVNTLLSKYAVRFYGYSVAQAGDPVPRYVLHCSPKKNTVGIISGKSGTGKSVLSSTLRSQGFSVFSTDHDFFGLHMGQHREHAPKTPLYQMIANNLQQLDMNLAAEKIIALNAVEEFCRDVISCLPLDEELSFVEGEVFTNPTIYHTFVAMLKKAGIVIWGMSRVG